MMKFWVVFGQCRFVSSLVLTVAVLSAACSGGTYSGGDGRSEATAFVIGTAADWEELTNTPADWGLGKHFVLAADIDLGGAAIKPVGKDHTRFSGSFDGGGHAIRNFVMDQAGIDFVGLFGYVGSGGQIRNLGAESFTISARNNVGGLCGYNYEGSIIASYAAGDVTGNDRVGGLCGYNYDGSIIASHAGGDATGNNRVGGLCGENRAGTISGSYATGSVSGNYYVGGLCGENYNPTGKISVISASYATGSVTGNGYYVGGLCGSNDMGTISESYATGSVTGSHFVGGLVGQNYIGKVIHCYSTGKPAGNSFVGGLCGQRTLGLNYADTGNFWDTQSSERPTSTMGTGMTTAQMKTLATYAGWDFAAVWAICEPTNYPRLWWQIAAADWVCPEGVGMEDLAYLAARWLEEDCGASEDCEGADLDGSGKVDLADLAVFAEQWAEGL